MVNSLGDLFHFCIHRVTIGSILGFTFSFLRTQGDLLVDSWGDLFSFLRTQGDRLIDYQGDLIDFCIHRVTF